MINYNTSSLLLPKHDHNGVFNQNLRSIQELIHVNDTAGIKFKCVCADLPNISILTKETKTVEFQVMFYHMTFGNKSLGKLTPISPFQDPLNFQHFLPLTLGTTTPSMATRYASCSQRFSFAPPPGTLIAQRTSADG